MNRKNQRRFALLLVVVLASPLAACTSSKQQVASAVVSPKGGAFELSGVKVTAPEGAVTKDTKLSVSMPTTNDKTTPFGQKAVVFDMSLEGGVQPVAGKPLTVEIPLKGGFLPEGASPQDAVLYTQTPSGHRLLYSEVIDGTLRAIVPHLSEKEIVYLKVPTIEEIFATRQAEISKTVCLPWVEHPKYGRVEVTTQNNTGPRVEACVELEGDKLRLRLVNKVNYIWSVAPQGLTLGFSGGTMDEQATDFIGLQLLAEPGVQHYLHPDGVLRGDLNLAQAQSVRLLASNTGLVAHVAWDTLKIALGLYAGKNDDEIVKWANRLINDFSDVENCLKATLSTRGGDLGAFLLALPEAVFNKCGEVIGKALIEISKDAAMSVVDLRRYFERAMRVGSLIYTALQNSIKSVVAMIEAAKGDITVRVGSCLTADAFVDRVADQLRDRESGGDLTGIYKNGSVTCSGGWAWAPLRYTFFGGYEQKVTPILRLKNGQWVFVDLEEICREAPREFLKGRDGC